GAGTAALRAADGAARIGAWLRPRTDGAVVGRDGAAESRGALFRNGEDQRPVLDDRVGGIEIDEVAVERPVARRPAVRIEAVELVRPVEHELAVFVPVGLD